MPILKCKICGGDIVLDEEKTFGTCECCGSTMTLPKVSDEQRAALFNRGNHFRRTGDFDKALAIYENIVREDDADAEAHWCCALCRFGIEYVEDPNTYEFVPTCHRASFDSILEDVDYLAAIENSDGITRRQYQKDAAKIAEVQKGILATSQNEEPFDVFICYKETDDTTKQRTKDSLDAQEIYYQLTNEGYRVFFSRITLEDKAGAEYEPYIFAALNSAKVMVAIGSKPEYFNAVWVKNEWSRFLALMRKDRSKLLLPCYKGMDPYDLPEQLSVLQSYDMAKIGFIQDLTRGIRKIIKSEEKKPVAKETVVVENSTNVAPLLKRAFMFLEDGNWAEADTYFERVLDQDPENANAYLGKLMAEQQVHRQEELADCKQPFDRSNNYQKAIRFGDEALSSALRGYVEHINERNENARLINIYNNAISTMNVAQYESTYKAAAQQFRTISGFKDADVLAERCFEKAEICRKDDLYKNALLQASNSQLEGYKAAISIFQTISGWKDSDVQILFCQKRIEEIEAKEEADRLERERLAEQKRIAEKKAAKKRKIRVVIISTVLIMIIVFVIVRETVIVPKQKQNKAKALLDSGDYEEAYALLNELGDIDAITANKYDRALTSIEAGDYETAYVLLNNLNYKDSINRLESIKKQYQKILLSKKMVGDYLVFGAYEQDNNTYNGKEEIEWLVLDREGSQLFVISRYALDCQQYNTSDVSVTWETCSLRTWLNVTFIDNAFSDDEQVMIQSTTVTADENPSYSTSPGNDTMDRVFLLSILEANVYFKWSDRARQCKVTTYVKSQGVFDSANLCRWWLRSPGHSSYYASYIQNAGAVGAYGIDVDCDYVAVRPAMWIDLDAWTDN